MANSLCGGDLSTLAGEINIFFESVSRDLAPLDAGMHSRSEEVFPRPVGFGMLHQRRGSQLRIAPDSKTDGWISQI